MNKKESSESNYNQPVAYDVDGNPLYAHPLDVNKKTDSQPQVVHMTRPISPDKPVIDEITRLKHERSKKAFPDLDLSEGEYIISAIRRHIIGLFIPFFLGSMLITFAFIFLFNYDLVFNLFRISNENIAPFAILLPVIVFSTVVILGTYITYYVFVSNRFFLTNESVIQEIQTGLFSKSEQIVSLANIEDASYTQNGIVQQIFDFGSIRLSTEGEETTYKFSYVMNPKEAISILNNAVESFKNGRPVDGN